VLRGCGEMIFAFSAVTFFTESVTNPRDGRGLSLRRVGQELAHLGIDGGSPLHSILVDADTQSWTLNGAPVWFHDDGAFQEW